MREFTVLRQLIYIPQEYYLNWDLLQVACFFWASSEGFLVRYYTSADSGMHVGSVLICPLALNHLCLAGMCLWTVPWPDSWSKYKYPSSTAKVTLRHPKQHTLNQVALGAWAVKAPKALWYPGPLGAGWKRLAALITPGALYDTQLKKTNKLVKRKSLVCPLCAFLETFSWHG